MIGDTALIRAKHSSQQLYQQDIRQRRPSVVPSQHNIGSRRRSFLREDFTKLCIPGAKDWLINKEISAILAQSTQITIVGVVGDMDECRATIQTIVKQNISVHSYEEEGIYLSRQFLLGKKGEMPIAFLVCTFRPSNTDTWKFQLMAGVLSHVLLMFDWTKSLLRVSRYNQTLKTSDKRFRAIMGVQQSLVVFGQGKNLNSKLGSEDAILEWGQVQIRGKADIPSHQESINQFIVHNIRRNYATINSYHPVGYYYLFVSMWEQLKGPTFKLDYDLFVKMYIENIEKGIQDDYMSQVQDYFQQNKDDMLVYQCLKSIRETHRTKFNRLIFFCKKEALLNLQRLTKFISNAQEDVVRKNVEGNSAQNARIAHQCSSKLQKAMDYKCYQTKNMSTFSEDFSGFLDEYKMRSLGQNRGETLRHWIRDFSKTTQTYFTDIINNDLSRSVAKSENQSRQGLIQRIALTQGMLSTVEKEIIALERKRTDLQSLSRIKKTKIQHIRKSLKQSRERLRHQEQRNRDLRQKARSADLKPPNIVQGNTSTKNKKRSRWLCFG